SAFWKHAHLQPLLILRQRHVTTTPPFAFVIRATLGNQPLGFGMKNQLAPQCLRGRLACTVVGCGTDAPATEYDVGRRETARQYFDDFLLIVRHDLHPPKVHATL